MKVLGVIPARYASRRFEGKALADLLGKPMIQHVYERASKAGTLDGLMVATDDQRIFEAVRGFGGEVAMTAEHPTGTDRIAEVAGRVDAEILVNVQGDEPLIEPAMIDEAVKPFLGSSDIELGTLVHRIHAEAEYVNPNVVKVVVDRSGFAMYFSRSPIPHIKSPLTPLFQRGELESGLFQRGELESGLSRSEGTGSGLSRSEGTGSGLSRSEGTGSESSRSDGTGSAPSQERELKSVGWREDVLTYRHVGLYVYSRHVLLDFAQMPPAPLEMLEGLEQLRFLENGYRMKVVETSYESVGVDTPEDLEKVRRIMSEWGKWVSE